MASVFYQINKRPDWCIKPVRSFTIQIQNTEYKGTEYKLLFEPKFLTDILYAISGLYFCIYSVMLFALTFSEDFTSKGIIFPFS